MFDFRGVEHAPAVDQEASPHTAADLVEVEIAVLRPVGDEHHRVGQVGDRIDVVHDEDVRQIGERADDRIVRDDTRATLHQPSRDVDGRRVAQIVGVGLEREPQQADPTAPQAAQPAAQLAHDQAALRRVDVDRRLQEPGFVPVIPGRSDQLGDVLAEARTTPPDACVEEATTDALFADPRQAYTRNLIASVPRLSGGTDFLAIAGAEAAL